MRAVLISIRLTEPVAAVSLSDEAWAARRGQLRVEEVLTSEALRGPDWFVLQAEDGRRLKVRLDDFRLAEGQGFPFSSLAPRVRAGQRPGRLLHPESGAEAARVRADLWSRSGRPEIWRGTLLMLGGTKPEDLLAQGLEWVLELGSDRRAVRLERLRATPGGEQPMSFRQVEGSDGQP